MVHHSPIRVTDKEGTPQNLYAYDAFGTIQKKEESLLMSFGFTGYLKEPWEDMYYTGSREYNPVNGSFQSKDQYRYMDYQDPVSINLYTYAKANPLRCLDFDGHESIWEKSYWDRTVDMVLYGNFSEDVTGLGIAINILLGLTGIDFLLDGRDLTADLTVNYEPENPGWWLATGCDLLGLIPIIGVIKNIDEAVALVKYSDEAAEVLKHTDEVADAAKRGSKFDNFDVKTASSKQKGNFGEFKADENLLNNESLKEVGYDLKSIGRAAPNSPDDPIVKGIDER